MLAAGGLEVVNTLPALVLRRNATDGDTQKPSVGRLCAGVGARRFASLLNKRCGPVRSVRVNAFVITASGGCGADTCDCGERGNSGDDKVLGDHLISPF